MVVSDVTTEVSTAVDITTVQSTQVDVSTVLSTEVDVTTVQSTQVDISTQLSTQVDITTELSTEIQITTVPSTTDLIITNTEVQFITQTSTIFQSVTVTVTDTEISTMTTPGETPTQTVIPTKKVLSAALRCSYGNLVVVPSAGDRQSATGICDFYGMRAARVGDLISAGSGVMKVLKNCVRRSEASLVWFDDEAISAGNTCRAFEFSQEDKNDHLAEASCDSILQVLCVKA